MQGRRWADIQDDECVMDWPERNAPEKQVSKEFGSQKAPEHITQRTSPSETQDEGWNVVSRRRKTVLEDMLSIGVHQRKDEKSSRKGKPKYVNRTKILNLFSTHPETVAVWGFCYTVLALISFGVLCSLY